MSLPADKRAYRIAGDLAGAAFYRTRTPMLLLDATGIIADINVTCRELFGLDVAGCKGQHVSYLDIRLRGKGQGSLLPPHGVANTYFAATGTAKAGHDGSGVLLRTKEIGVATSDYRYHSNRYGTVLARVSELPCIHTGSGACIGSAVSLEIIDMADCAAWHPAVDRCLARAVLWEVYAASYDRVLPEVPFYREVVERHCAALRPHHINAVLDIGAGTGTVALRLLQLGKRVTAVDVNRAMLEKLRCKVGAEQADDLTIIEDTAELLPHLQDGSFDGVNVLLAFFAMSDRLSAFTEAQRTLKPGGTLIVTEPRACFDERQLSDCAEASLRAKGLSARLEPDLARIKSIAPLIRDTIQKDAGWHAEAILKQLKQNGFADLSFRESHMGNCATITGIKPK